MGIAYRERAHLQVIHWVPVARAGGRKTAPVLVWGDRVFADSADIVEEASAQAPPDRALFSPTAAPAYPPGSAEGCWCTRSRPERFSAADLTFASLAASLLMPPEYGVPLPQPDELPPPWPRRSASSAPTP